MSGPQKPAVMHDHVPRIETIMGRPQWYIWDPVERRAIPVDMMTASLWRCGSVEEQEASWRVGDTTVGAARVSTVFLTLDQEWLEGPPVLWETMIFGGPLGGRVERYSSATASESGHWRNVAYAMTGRIR